LIIRIQDKVSESLAGKSRFAGISQQGLPCQVDNILARDRFGTPAGWDQTKDVHD